jgi:thiosulfate dehydrogenase
MGYKSLCIFSLVIITWTTRLLAQQISGNDSLSWGILVPKNATLARAWEIPRDPTALKVDNNSPLMKSVKRGFALFMNTSKLAPSLSGGAMACNNCHPNGGQRENAMPLVGVARVFPEYNKRSGRTFSLEDRIVGCLLRSINATGSRNPSLVTRHENDLAGATLNSLTREVKDLAAYITWLSSGLTIDRNIPWRGRNTLPTYSLLPVEKLDPKLGRRYFDELCATCHGTDGQGTGTLTLEIANQLGIKPKHPGPLWGPKSWNDGAGAARTYTLAGMIRHWMPYLTPGILSDEQAQHIAAFITSQPRPGYPYKEKDYLKEKIPPDAVYYRQLYSKNPLGDR